MASIKKKVVAVNTEQEQPAPKSLLQQAHEIIYGDREQTYGNPSKNLEQIAKYWSVHLSGTIGEEICLTPADVCEMMILLKVARLGNTPNHTDSLLDIAGYAALQDRVQKGS